MSFDRTGAENAPLAAAMFQTREIKQVEDAQSISFEARLLYWNDVRDVNISRDTAKLTLDLRKVIPAGVLRRAGLTGAAGMASIALNGDRLALLSQSGFLVVASVAEDKIVIEHSDFLWEEESWEHDTMPISIGRGDEPTLCWIGDSTILALGDWRAQAGGSLGRGLFVVRRSGAGTVDWSLRERIDLAARFAGVSHQRLFSLADEEAMLVFSSAEDHEPRGHLVFARVKQSREGGETEPVDITYHAPSDQEWFGHFNNLNAAPSARKSIQLLNPYCLNMPVSEEHIEAGVIYTVGPKDSALSERSIRLDVESLGRGLDGITADVQCVRIVDIWTDDSIAVVVMSVGDQIVIASGTFADDGTVAIEFAESLAKDHTPFAVLNASAAEATLLLAPTPALPNGGWVVRTVKLKK
jgi:hypothetical protein